MLTSKFVRWSGLVLLLAGVLVAIPTLLHPDEIADPSVMQSASWVPVHTAFIVGVVLSIFGLIGLYLRQLEKGGWLGTIGFALTIVGSILTVVILTIDAYIVPIMAADAEAQALLDPNGPLFTGPLGLEFMLAALTFALGAAALGIAVIRAGILPRGAGGLLLIGGPIMGFSGLLPHPIFLVGGVLLGASFVWLGYAIWVDPVLVTSPTALPART